MPPRRCRPVFNHRSASLVFSQSALRQTSAYAGRKQLRNHQETSRPIIVTDCFEIVLPFTEPLARFSSVCLLSAKILYWGSKALNGEVWVTVLIRRRRHRIYVSGMSLIRLIWESGIDALFAHRDAKIAERTWRDNPEICMQHRFIAGDRFLINFHVFTQTMNELFLFGNLWLPFRKMSSCGGCIGAAILTREIGRRRVREEKKITCLKLTWEIHKLWICTIYPEMTGIQARFISLRLPRPLIR